MPRNKDLISKKPKNRPLLPIDWDKVDKLLMAGCTGTEIAPTLGVSPDTLYMRTEIEKGKTFSVYSSEKKSRGNASLRAAQFAKAMQGNTTMQIFLGKNRLEQHDGRDEKKQIPEEIEQNFRALMKQISDLRSESSHSSFPDNQESDRLKLEHHE